MYRVFQKLKLLEPLFKKLRQWKGDLAMNVKQAANFLKSAKMLLQRFPNNSLLQDVEKLCRVSTL